jgi:hypothetical protein
MKLFLMAVLSTFSISALAYNFNHNHNHNHANHNFNYNFKVKTNLLGCWAYDSDQLSYPIPEEVDCYASKKEAKKAAMKSCKTHSDAPGSCHIVTCSWCG